MKFKYYHLCLMAFFICIILSVIYAMPYGFNFHEEEKNFEKATILVIAPNKGERKIRLEADSDEYWLSCYGFEEICTNDLINKKLDIKKVRILVNTQKTVFLNGVLLDYYDNHHHINQKYDSKKDKLFILLIANTIFSFKLALIFLVMFIFLRIKKI